MPGSLDAREELFALQQAMLKIDGPVVLQLGLNMPGGHIHYPWQVLFDAALAKLRLSLSCMCDIVMIRETQVQTDNGPYCLFAVRADAFLLKQQMVRLEESEPLGRLWDIDIITSEGVVGRSSLGLLPRPCLICGASAHVCRRLACHSLSQVIAATHSLIQAAGVSDNG